MLGSAYPTVSMFRYQYCGLRISSAIELQELMPYDGAADEADVVITLGPIDRAVPSPVADGGHFRVTTAEAHFFWEVSGHFLVAGGRTIVVDPAPGAPPELIRLPLLGAVFAALLCQRGFLVLHGSAVAVGDVAVALVGEKGTGKSTTAAAFRQAGHTVLVDDVLALRLAGDGRPPRVWPAFPQLKLWPEAALATGADPAGLPSLHDRVVKRSLVFHEAFTTRPLPLRRLYFLEWGEHAAIEPMSAQEAFAGVVPHAFARRYGPDGPETARHLLHACTELVREVPVRRLVRRPDLSRLSGVVAAVLEDLAGGGPEPDGPVGASSASPNLAAGAR